MKIRNILLVLAIPAILAAVIGVASATSIDAYAKPDTNKVDVMGKVVGINTVKFDVVVSKGPYDDSGIVLLCLKEKLADKVCIVSEQEFVKSGEIRSVQLEVNQDALNNAEAIWIEALEDGNYESSSNVPNPAYSWWAKNWSDFTAWIGAIIVIFVILFALHIIKKRRS